MKKVLSFPGFIVFGLFVLTISLFVLTTCERDALAQASAQCEGPKDMCDKIAQLQGQLAAKDQATVPTDRIAWLIASAGTISVLLKMLISGLTNWSKFFRFSDRSGAVIRLLTIAAGLLSGLFANLAFHIPWWQAIIVMAGGPGAIAFHELLQIIPALRGTGPLPAEEAVAAVNVADSSK
jgi:hypothetical protein